MLFNSTNPNYTLLLTRVRDPASVTLKARHVTYPSSVIKIEKKRRYFAGGGGGGEYIRVHIIILYSIHTKRCLPNITQAVSGRGIWHTPDMSFGLNKSVIRGYYIQSNLHLHQCQSYLYSVIYVNNQKNKPEILNKRKR